MVNVLRIVADIRVDDPAALADFYAEVFDLDILMDHGWIVTLGSAQETRPQLSFAAEGGSGARVPDLSVEVDDLDAVHARIIRRGAEVVYGITREPWGVRRFFFRDPAGRVVNVLTHG